MSTMKDSVITEIVKFRIPGTTNEEELKNRVNHLNELQKSMDGYINAELIKNVSENSWHIIYHYTSLERVKIIGEKIRGSEEFRNFMQQIITESLDISFHHQIVTTRSQKKVMKEKQAC